MSSLECLTEFVNERLKAAAEEISGALRKITAEQEKEFDRQRKLLDAIWKPEIRLQRRELSSVTLTDQQCTKRETNTSVDQEEPASLRIKEEEGELCTTPEGEQLVVKQETDTCLLTSTYEERDHLEPELNRDHQLLSNNSHVADSQDPIGATHGDSLSSSEDAEPQPKRRHHKSNSDQLLSNDSHVAEKQNQRRGKDGNSRPATDAKPKPTKRHRESRIHSNKDNNHTMSKTDHNTQTGQTSFKCDTCGIVCTFKSQLDRHMRIHTGEKPFTCTECSRSFNQSTTMKRHMRIHTGEKPFTCTECSRSFNQSTTMKRHMRIHTGEKPFTCTECSRSFIDSGTLKRHMRIHTGEKPYTCTECSGSFNQSANLKSHMRIHTDEKPFTCTECSRSFNWRRTLKEHMRIHSGEKPFACRECSRSFRFNGNLVYHMMTHKGKKN